MAGRDVLAAGVEVELGDEAGVFAPGGSVGGFTPSYDSNGNLLDDPVTATHNVNAYDAEGRAVTFEGTTVVYDALAGC